METNDACGLFFVNQTWLCVSLKNSFGLLLIRRKKIPDPTNTVRGKREMGGGPVDKLPQREFSM